MSGYSTYEQLRNDLSEEMAESRRLATELAALRGYSRVDILKEPGWYWFKGAYKPSVWTCLYVLRDGHGDLWVKANGEETLIREFSRGEWRGPIPEPTP
mgnify:CR=1 FL=1